MQKNLAGSRFCHTIFALTVLTVFASSICAYADTDDGETGYVTVSRSVIRPSYSEDTYLVVGNDGKPSYVSADDLKSGTVSYESTDETAAVYPAVPEAGEASMVSSLAIYSAPVSGSTASSGSWEVSDDGTHTGRYLGDDGETCASGGWLFISDTDSALTREGSWYCFDEYGYVRSGWISLGDERYFCSEDPYELGAMKTGWLAGSGDGYIYYLDTISGIMQTGWQKIDGWWYYFAEEADASHTQGAMYISEQTPDGWYTGSDGKWTEE